MAANQEDIEVDCTGITSQFDLIQKKFYKDHIILAQKKKSKERVLLVRVKTDMFTIDQRKQYIRVVMMMCKNHQIPGMVKFEKIIQDGLDIALVQNFNAYGVLKDLIKQAYSQGKPFTEKFVLRWLAHLVHTIHCLHQRRTIHGNLHAMNIYMDEDTLHVGPIEGFSRILEDPQTFAGKGDIWKSNELDDLDRANYMAPEMMERKMPGPKYDIWCIGVLAHFMTTLTYPFQSSAPDRVVAKMLRTPPSFVNFETYNFKPDLKDWISSCLHKNLKERPSAEELMNSEVLRENMQEIMATQQTTK